MFISFTSTVSSSCMYATKLSFNLRTAFAPCYRAMTSFLQRIGNRLELHSKERNKIAITHTIPMAYDGMFLPISIVLRGFSGSIS